MNCEVCGQKINKVECDFRWLKEARVKAQVTLRQFALANKLDAANLSRYERGLQPAPRKIKKLYDALWNQDKKEE